jgi:hypothetical protein
MGGHGPGPLAAKLRLQCGRAKSALAAERAGFREAYYASGFYGPPARGSAAPCHAAP